MKLHSLFACVRPLPQASGESPSVPTLAFCRTPNHYSQEMERHFGGDMAKLCAYIAQQPAEQQKAVIDGSEALRDFLGIRNPDGFRKKFLSSSSSSSRIQDADAPAALAMAALCASKETRVLRALTRLDETLDKNLSRFQDNNSYRQTVQTAFHQLLTFT